MLPTKIFQSIRPFITSVVVVVVIGLLVFAIYFSDLGKQWIVFLGGVLIASIISMASRASRAEWIITQRTEQLARSEGVV